MFTVDRRFHFYVAKFMERPNFVFGRFRSPLTLFIRD